MPKTSDVGVVVGRFQVHQLHAAHLKLLQHVHDTHKQLVIVLGLGQARVSTRNPLDFEARKQMLLAAFPTATVFYLRDHASDAGWSESLDRLLADYLSPAQVACLYGGRDSFIAHYTGRHRTEVLEPDVYVSGTELRRDIGKSVKASADFRAGVIWAAANGHPRAFPTVDVAIYRDVAMHDGKAHDDCDSSQQVREWLLVRKPAEKLWRFCGGFVQPTDGSYEAAARREAREETGAELGALHYVCSHRVDDWRYRNEDDKIVTAFYAAPLVFGPIRPADDVSEARWFTEANIWDEIVSEHEPLANALSTALQVPVEKGGLK